MTAVLDLIRTLLDALDELEAIAADPHIDAEDKVEMTLDCIKEARERAMEGDKK